jgi:hypothetical protein
MKPGLVAGAACWIVMTSAVVFAQQRVADPGAQAPPTGVTERTYIYGGIASSRIVERRSDSGGRELVVVTVEQPGVDGRWTPVEETVTETDRTDARAARTRRQLFGFDADRRRTLRETTESTEEPLGGGDSRAVEETWVADINGGARRLVTRWIDERRTVPPDVRTTNTTLFRRGINGDLRESERTTQTERQIEPAVVRYETSQLVRDPNGRWMPLETRSGDVRNPTATERVEEETIHRPDINGTLALSERIVTRRSEVNGQEQLVVETYSPDAEGFLRTGGPVALRQRVRRSTTAASDGGQSIVEEVEARSRVSPSDPMRVVQRTVVTVRNAGPNRLITERQVFERDVDGRMALVMTETEEHAAK